jgi:L-cysteine desulfidase
MIDEAGPPAGKFAVDVQEETTMLKTISAVLLAASVLAAPAMAAGTAGNRGATHAAPVIKSVQVKKSVLNANAKMGRHHHRHGHHHHHRHHGHR